MIDGYFGEMTQEMYEDILLQWGPHLLHPPIISMTGASICAAVILAQCNSR
jgi:hypothetical protein